MSVLFLREHNRIARSLEKRVPGLGRRAALPDDPQHPHRDPDQDRGRGVHQPHLALPPQAARRPDAASATRAGTGRTGWRSSSTCSTAGTASCRRASASAAATSPSNDTLFNTDIVVEHGLGACFEDASNQRAGRVGLFNSPPELWHAEVASVEQARAVELRPYNEYRGLARFPRATRFEEISSDAAVQQAPAGPLRRRRPDRVLPRPVRRGRPAQRRAALADRPDGRDRRLLAGVHQPAALPARLQRRDVLAARLGLIRTTRTLSDLLHRNVPDRARRHQR